MNDIYASLLKAIKHYGSTEDDIVSSCMRIKRDQVSEHVVIAPWWEPDIFSWSGELLSGTERASIKVWRIMLDGMVITYVKSGIGAPVLDGLSGMMCSRSSYRKCFQMVRAPVQ